MRSNANDWEKIANQVLHEVRSNYSAIGRSVSQGAHPTVLSLLELQQITVSDDIGDAGFELADDRRSMKLSLSGLELVLATGRNAATRFGGRSESEFRFKAMRLFLFHEVNHISGKLITFEDVQFLKRTCGLDRLGQLDLIADCVAAQIYSGLMSSLFKGGQNQYNEHFAEALEFMTQFCFPAFKFPFSKFHKVQRAMGILLMLARARLALGPDSQRGRVDAPLYPSFSDDLSEVLVFEFPEDRPFGVVRAKYLLAPESTRLLLENIDCGDLSWLMERV